MHVARLAIVAGLVLFSIGHAQIILASFQQKLTPLVKAPGVNGILTGQQGVIIVPDNNVFEVRGFSDNPSCVSNDPGFLVTINVSRSFNISGFHFRSDAAGAYQTVTAALFLPVQNKCYDKRVRVGGFGGPATVEGSFPLNITYNVPFYSTGGLFTLMIAGDLSATNKNLSITDIKIYGNVGCSPYSLPNGVITPFFLYPNHSSTVSLSCSPGYSLLGSNNSTCCQGVWSNSASCTPTPNYCALPDIPNGVVGVCPRTIGSTCYTYCDTGYLNASISYGTCGASGTISGSPFLCQLDPNYCRLTDMPASVTNGTCGFSLGADCTFYCPAGYFPPVSVAQCSIGPKWGTYDYPSCAVNTTYCSLPPAPGNGSRGCCAQSIGGACQFTCNTGYNSSQALTRTCLAPGIYNGSSVTCQRMPDYCPYPSLPVNGIIPSCGTGYNDNCYFDCIGGYAPSATVRTCTAARTFSGSPIVCIVDSGYCKLPPAPAFGSRDACNQTLNGTCLFSCSPGYNITNPVRTCLLSTNYSGSASTCDLIDSYCPTPTAPSHASLGSCVQSIGGTCSFTCDPGYQASGNGWTCLAGQTWATNGFVCSVVAGWCPAPAQPQNGALTTCTQTVGSICNISCNAGFQAAGAVPTCQADHTYSSIMTCSAIPDYCPPPPALGNATVTASDRTVFGATVYQCVPGFEGGGTLSCGAAQDYLGGPLSCTLIALYCAQPLPPTNGQTTTCEQFVGGACHFSCNPGYDAVNTTRMCLPSGAYTPAGTCEGVADWCEMPAVPDHGAIGTCSTALGGACHFSCLPGYEPLSVGATSRVCTLSGSYDQSDLVCNVVDNFCPSISSPSHGHKGTCGRNIDDFCEVYCDAGYSPAFSNLTCASSGEYTPLSSVQCTAIANYCTLPPVANGSLASGCTGKLGTQCIFTCDAGFIPAQTVIDCEVAGFSSSVSCTAVNCGELTQAAPANGAITCTGRSYGATCQVTCNDGYTVSGTAIRHCASSGNWDGAADASCTATNAAAIVTGGSGGSGGSAAVIGGAAGGGFALILLLVVIIVVVRRRAAKDKANDAGSATVRVSVSAGDVAKRRLEKMLAAKSTVQIGTGAFAKVYKAQLDDEWVAVKVLNDTAEALQASTEFHREATILSRLDGTHRNVISLRFFSQSPLAIAMELAEAGSVYAMIRDKTLPTNRQLEFASMIASGMAFLHANSVVHLDLKPENVLLGDQGQLKITDFGSAMIVGTDVAVDADGMSRPTQFLGTPQYAAPERFADRPHSLYKADVYSFGVTVWSMVMGETPFSGTDVDSVIETLTLSVGSLAKRFNTPPNINGVLGSAIHASMKLLPNGRPTFAELERTLKDELNGTATVLSHAGDVTANPLFTLETMGSQMNSFQPNAMGSTDSAGSSGAATVPAVPVIAPPPALDGAYV